MTNAGGVLWKMFQKFKRMRSKVHRVGGKESEIDKHAKWYNNEIFKEHKIRISCTDIIIHQR